MPLPYVPPGQTAVFTVTGIKPDKWAWHKDAAPLENTELYGLRDILICPACVEAELKSKKTKGVSLKLVK